VSATRTSVPADGPHDAKRLQLGNQALSVFLHVGALTGMQRLGKESNNLVQGLRAVQEQIKHRRGSGIQQMRIPGLGLEDNAIIVKVDDPQPFGSGVTRSLG
jgi:hypothetical protein